MAAGTREGRAFLEDPTVIPALDDVASTGVEGRRRLIGLLDDGEDVVRANALVLLAEIWGEDRRLEELISAGPLPDPVLRAATEMPADGRVARRLAPLILESLNAVPAESSELPAEFSVAEAWRIPDYGTTYRMLAARLWQRPKIFAQVDNAPSHRALALAARVNPADPMTIRSFLELLEEKSGHRQQLTLHELKAARALMEVSSATAEAVTQRLISCRLGDLRDPSPELELVHQILFSTEAGRRELIRRDLPEP